MNKLLLASVASLFVGLLSGCSVSEPASPAVAPLITITSAKDRVVPVDLKEIKTNEISFLVPKDWMACSKGLMSPDHTAVLTYDVAPSEYSFDVFVNEEMKELPKIPDMKVLLAHEILISGRDSLLVWAQNKKVLIQQLSIENVHTIHTLACGTLVKDVYPNQGICKDILSSVLFFN